MNLIAKLRETRPDLSFAELLAASGVRARFEGVDELRDGRGEFKRFRVYSIDGHLMEGQPILVPMSKSALEADSIAQAGLEDTIRNGRLALESLDSETDRELIAKPSDSAGLTGEQRTMIERILADRA